MSSSASSIFPRVLSLREKRRPNNKAKSPVPVDFHGLFTLPDGSKKATKEEEKRIQELTQQLTSLGHPQVPDARLEYVVRHSESGDTKDAFRLLMLFEDSVAGVLKPFDPKVSLLGAENREKVTCYLDSILFAMFVKVDVFESLLFNNFSDEPRRRLVTILRLWVNMLRTGRLITTDITQHLQRCLADCGWADASKIRQQDTSEAFGFITDQLELPLVTLKTDIYHSGKEAASDDHKFITERLLEVGIPDDVQQGQSVKLETCLEEYFNNRVEVRRELHRRNTLQKRSSIDKSDFVHVEEIVESPTQAAPTPADEEPPTQTSPKRPGLSHGRAKSIFSEKKVEIADDAKTEPSHVHATPATRQRTNSTRKEVLMPAWQFLNLIPWYTDNNAGKDFQVAAHFSEKRPMLGICLKRYVVSKTGAASRLNTHVDIPLEMAAPHFVTHEDFDDDNNVTTGQFKLTLQSVICHRGVSLNSGHYIALVRIGAPIVDQHASFGDIHGSQPQDHDHDTWIRFDDLSSKRITTVDIVTALKDESPYLLFYRVDPINDEIPLGNPPPYSENSDQPLPIDQKLSLLGTDGLGDYRRSLDIEGRSGRPSLEVNDGSVPRPRTSVSVSSDRVQSVVLTVSSLTPSIMSDIDSMGDVHERRDSLQPPTKSQSVPQSSRGSIHVADPSPPSETTAIPRPRPGRQARRSVDPEKRSSMSLSRITSRLGLDKSSRNVSSAVDETANEGLILDATKEKEKTTVSTVQVKPIKEKKGKGKASMRKKTSTDGGQKPDRECSVM